ncbi:hypothetical protein IWQ60_003408 [Tieghemiomyces parasiticus]|uniref:Uncharacterized protein n=1 Tax=Tieghemiomyces parasiticus TaxID=78921 RepID=A0A9W8AAA4_9FUNG|nr:hypothetical protein IWQ60_003408 [Tieghemiomyces parasiticus]
MPFFNPAYSAYDLPGGLDASHSSPAHPARRPADSIVLVHPTVIDTLFNSPRELHRGDWPRPLVRLFSALDSPQATHLARQALHPFQGHYAYLIHSVQTAMSFCLLILPNLVHALSGFALFDVQPTAGQTLGWSERRALDMQFPQLLHCLLVLAVLWQEFHRMCRSVFPAEVEQLAPTVARELVTLRDRGVCVLNHVGHEVTRLWCRWKVMQNPQLPPVVDRLADNQHSYMDIYGKCENFIKLLILSIKAVDDAKQIVKCPPLALNYFTPLANHSLDLTLHNPALLTRPNGAPVAKHARFALEPPAARTKGSLPLQQQANSPLSLHRSASGLAAHAAASSRPRLIRKRNISLPVLNDVALAAGTTTLTRPPARLVATSPAHFPQPSPYTLSNESTDTNLFSSCRVPSQPETAPTPPPIASAANNLRQKLTSKPSRHSRQQPQPARSVPQFIRPPPSSPRRFPTHPATDCHTNPDNARAGKTRWSRIKGLIMGKLSATPSRPTSVRIPSNDQAHLSTKGRGRREEPSFVGDDGSSTSTAGAVTVLESRHREFILSKQDVASMTMDITGFSAPRAF